MSSISHSRVRTIDKDCLCNAAKDLGIKIEETENEISVVGVHARYKFDNKGNVDVSYWDDVKRAKRSAKHLAQLSTFYTMRKRLEKSGLRMTKSVKDVILAVESNQKLTVEFEEEAEKVAVQS